MTLNDSIRYVDGDLYVDNVAISDIVNAPTDTPFYVYSLRRILQNYHRLCEAFSQFDAHIHFSAKANSNLTLLKTLINAGAGVDVVSGGEIFKALKAGVNPAEIVFAGVGKTAHEIQYALEAGVRWFNVENVRELDMLRAYAQTHDYAGITVALRLNPDVTANTHPYIATGHGGAKFGLTADVIANVLANQAQYPQLTFVGIHVHIGSQLGDTNATQQAIEKACELLAPYPDMRTINIGGGMPNAYHPDTDLPSVEQFAETLYPLLKDYTVLLEPGRSIVADAGVLVSRVLYTKQQAGQQIVIVDGSMTELIRPALYQATHQIVPVVQGANSETVQVVGPVCETADVLGKNVELPPLSEGDLVAILDAGAYGVVMANTYNARPRPAELVVLPDGETWQVARPRETWDDLVRGEVII